ncbi:MAG: hypothetical protein GXP14_03105 [Gammaproteobacteria bacterium]|nr:hypothetical protein [Gammaproteobacteria bacterium]
MSRVADLPVYAQRNEQINSTLYNLWRRARMHFTMPLRIEFPDRPGLILILEKNEWVCADESQNDLPVLAWVSFEDQGRDKLHMPVQCKLNYYHFAASKLRAPALELMENTLDIWLRDCK